MNKIIEYSLKRPLTIIMLSILVCISGIISIFTIPMDFLPQISDRHILVSTSYQGIPAAQMKELVTIPIEDAFSSLKGIKNISSTTRDGMSFIKIELHYKTNINSALIESQQLIDKLSNILPNDCDKPEVEIFTTDKNKILTLALIPNTSDLIFTKDFASKEFKHILQTINGVGKIQIRGGEEEEITITFDPNLLNKLNLSLIDISDILKSTNYEYPLGTIKDKENEYILKSSNLFKNYNDIMNTFIPSKNYPIALKDIGTISSSKKNKTNFAFCNSKECVLIDIYKKSKSNPIQTTKSIIKKIKETEENYPSIKFKVIQDFSNEIKISILNVFISAIFGSLITFFVIYIFFKNIKLSLIISFPIPLCILFSIIILNLFSKTINLFSLSGITIAIGMTVDSSIIILETIISNSNGKILTDKNMYQSIIKSKKSIFSSSITTIIVFIPFFLLPGIFGELFTDLSISIISSIIFSYILSITFIPVLIKLFIKSQIHFNENKFILVTKTKYKTFLSKNITKISILKNLTILFLLASFLSLSIIKKEMIPENKTNNFKVTVSFFNNNSIEAIQNKTYELIKKIETASPSTTIITIGGIDTTDKISLSNFLINQKDVTFHFFYKTPKDKNTIIKIIQSINLEYKIIPSQDLISSFLDLTNNYILLKPTNKEQNNFSFEKTPGKPNNFSQETIFIPDIKKCNFYKIPKYYISIFLYQLYEGIEAGFFFSNKKQIPITLNYNNNFDLSNTFIHHEDKNIPLNILGHFSNQTTQKIFYRYNKNDAKEIEKNLFSKKNELIISLKEQQLKELKNNTFIILSVVILLLYCTLGAQFESFLLPLIFIFSLIPAFSGALFFLLLFNQSININSILSFVILFGIGVNNSIILFESIQNKKYSVQTYINNFTEQLSPILITTITSCTALLPFTIDPFGINSQTSMSIALCAGLITSMISNQIIIPILFNHSFKKWRK